MYELLTYCDYPLYCTYLYKFHGFVYCICLCVNMLCSPLAEENTVSLQYLSIPPILPKLAISKPKALPVVCYTNFAVTL